MRSIATTISSHENERRIASRSELPATVPGGRKSNGEDPKTRAHSGLHREPDSGRSEPEDHPAGLATVADLNAAFDAGLLTSEQLVEMCLARIPGVRPPRPIPPRCAYQEFGSS